MVVAASVTALGVVASVATIGQTTGECDNFAGTCLRGRQTLAIFMVRAAAVVTVVLGLAGATGVAWKGRLPRWGFVVLVLAGVYAGGVLLTDPIPNLNNRYSGWLGDGHR